MKRKIGDRVWVQKYAGFQISGKWGVIPDTEGNRESMDDPVFCRCMLDCGDDSCHEWCDVLFDDGSYAYHVSECQMFNEPQT